MTAVATPDAGRPARQDAVENAEFAAFGRRMIRAMGRRVADGDVDGLADLLRLREEVDAALQSAVDGLRSPPWLYSWAEIGRAVGLTRTAAHDRWGKR